MELSWETLKKDIYDYDKDTLLDIYVQDATQEDWKNWAECVNDKYEVSFYNYQTNKYENKINPTVVIEYFSSRYEDTTSIEAVVNLGDILIRCHFFVDTEIENDFNPDDVEGMDDHYKIMDYLTNISQRLNKTVILTPENVPDFALISVKSEQIELNKF